MNGAHTTDGQCTCYGCINGDDRACVYCGEVAGADVCLTCTTQMENAQPPEEDQ